MLKARIAREREGYLAGVACVAPLHPADGRVVQAQMRGQRARAPVRDRLEREASCSSALMLPSRKRRYRAICRRSSLTSVALNGDVLVLLADRS